MNLCSMKYINTVAKKKNEHASSYRQARTALLHLKGVEELADFPLLKKEDMYSKNAAGARGLGDGAVTDSWIWTYGRLRGMTDVEKHEFLLDGTCSEFIGCYLTLTDRICSLTSSVVPNSGRYTAMDRGSRDS